MPYLVEQLLEDKPEPTCTELDQPVALVLTLMLENGFSQLPVVDAAHRQLGMITYESILRTMRNFNARLDDLHVRDAYISAPIFNLEDDLFDLLEQLKIHNAVLIVDPEQRLIGIVTSYDSTEYFRARAENLMRIADIESTLKDVILTAYQAEDGSVDTEALDQAVARVDLRQAPGGKAKQFEELSLGQYIGILINKHTWTVYEPILRISRERLTDMLEGVRETRNTLAHFKQELTSEQIDQLRFCADWLGRRWDEYAAAAEKRTVSLGEKHPEDGKPTPGETAQGGGKYARLAAWLQARPGRVDKVQTTFAEIEQIIGSDLPVSAYRHRAWWANDSQDHHHARQWLSVGWKTSHLNMTEKTVTFVRIRDREEGYIHFYSKLLAELREQATFEVRDVSPGGSYWLGCRYITALGRNHGHFGYSFIRGKDFRVELYLDTGDQETNKQVFDRIRSHVPEIQAGLEPISWERLPEKQASRIAIYHAGDISQSEEKLSELRTWGVKTLNAFVEVLEPVAVQELTAVLTEMQDD